MKPRTILSVFAVFIAVFSCSLIGYILGVNAAFEGNPPKQTVQSTVKGIPAKTEIPDSDDIGNSSKNFAFSSFVPCNLIFILNLQTIYFYILFASILQNYQIQSLTFL